MRTKPVGYGLLILSLSLLTACLPFGKTIGGSITGLTGTGLVLQNNATYDLAVTAGSTQFTFAKSIASGGSYAVTVLIQPQNQTCTVSNGSGTVVDTNISNVAINCVAAAQPHLVGGSIAWLTAAGLVLQNNGGDDLTVAARSIQFSFAKPIVSGANYAVSVLTPPQNQTCTVSNGSGTVGNADVSNVVISCVANTHFLYLQGLIKNGTHTDSVLDIIPIDASTGALGQGNAMIVGSMFTLNGGTPLGNAVTFYIPPTGNYAYRAFLQTPTMGASYLSAGLYWSVYSSDANTGALTSASDGASASAPSAGGGSSLAALYGNYDANLAFHPSGRFALDAASSSGIAAYAVNTAYADNVNTYTRVLTRVSGNALAANACPNTAARPDPNSFFAFHPSGKFAYSLNVSSDKNCPYHGIYAYSIDLDTGALGVLPGSPFLPQGMKSPGSITIHPSGKFAYVLDRGTYDATSKTYNVAESGLYLFGIAPATGVLSASGSKLPLSSDISSLNFEPSGRFAYMYRTSASADTIAAYAVDFGTGMLTEVPGSPFAPSNPLALPVGSGGELLFYPTCKYVYARGNGGGVRAYAIDASSGALTEIPGSIVQTPSPMSGPNYIR